MLSGFHRRGATMGRTLLVATATLAILAVCYAMYEFSQPDEVAENRPTPHRLPPVPTDVQGDDGDDAGDTSESAQSANLPTKAGDMKLGSGRGTTFTVYNEEGTKSRLEIKVDKWAPLPGATNEFTLARPVVRMRTNDGHSILATAMKGKMEREADSTQLKIRRFELSDEVVIKIDRLTERERAELPEPLRGKIDPAQLVRLDMDHVVYDREYSKVRIDGPFRLAARDAVIEAQDIEVAFNEAAGRLEFGRFNGAGRIELMRDTSELGLSLPGMASSGAKQQSLVDWMRASLEERLASKQPDAQEAEPVAEVTETTQEGLPVFDAGDGGKRTSKPKAAVKYKARFAGEVEVRQFMGEVENSFLGCDFLDILRDFSDRDRQRVRTATKPSDAVEGEAAELPQEKIVLTWGELLEITAEEQLAKQTRELNVRSRIIATGAPVRVSNARGGATSHELMFEPDGGVAVLTGTEDEPVSVFVPGQGTISGVEVHSRQTDGLIHLHVIGPGFLRRDIEPSEVSDDTEGGAAAVSRIDFGEVLEIHGREVTRTAVSLTKGLAGIVSADTARVIDTAVFTGRAEMRDGETRLGADTLTIAFDERRAGLGNRQIIESIHGVGHAAMSRGADRLTCDDLDLAMTADERGRPVPTKATASGHVNALQGTRTIEAGEHLIVDFEAVKVEPEPFDPARAYRKALAAGIDVATVDWDEARRKHEASGRIEPIVRRLRAASGVEIVDPTQSVDLSADSIDCTVVNGREIETAEVIGSEDRPASVRIEAFTVSGPKVRVNVVEDWAEVPGAGRMTFRSMKDLDGRTVANPIPISVTWDDWMKYRGERGEARFVGNVHATSESTTTFDGDELLVLFEEAGDAGTTVVADDWWIFQGLADRVRGEKSDDAPRLAGGRFSKEPVEVVAIGHARAQLAELDESTGGLKSRATINGPRLSVDLRAGVSKMLIEGAGSLLLEDFRPADQGESPSDDASGSVPAEGLLDVNSRSGPSKTAITWRDVMWYDFANHQTLFEGGVKLRHVSGSELDKQFARSQAGGGESSAGRRATLACQRLAVDFVAPDQYKRARDVGRMGGLSAARLRRFHAEEDVVLNDPAIGVLLRATTVTFERGRRLLAIHGTDRQRAELTLRRPGELPTKTTARRIYLDPETLEVEAKDPIVHVP